MPFQPILTLALKKSKIDPLVGTHKGRDEATNPLHLEYKLLKSRILYGVATWDQKNKSWENWLYWAAGQG